MKYYLQETGGRFISHININPKNGCYFRVTLPSQKLTLFHARRYYKYLNLNTNPNDDNYISGTPVKITAITAGK